MAFFKAKIGDTTYELEKLTLGDTRILKHKFGLIDLAQFSSTDPDVIVGLLSLAIRKQDPSKTIEQAAAEADEINFDDFTTVDDEKEAADEAPLEQVADASEATVAPEEPTGSPETTPETPGDPSTPST